MTVKQKQHLLAYLGYYSGTVDGNWGNLSRQAVEAFQRDYCQRVDGIWGEETRRRILEVIASGEQPAGDGWWEDITYFTREEFRCRCGGRYCSGFPAEMRREVVQVCDRARKHFGRPGHVVSGLRCPRHNASQGGVENSQHIFGEAVDLRIEGITGEELLEFVQVQPEVRYAYRINSTNVHFDIPKGAR